ncbi:MAG: multidrug resistance efflux pump [Verrucomicrobiales bacterium]|nr:multidrug resistance efflux pump [Verrucomicrobiales bacterium]
MTARNLITSLLAHGTLMAGAMAGEAWPWKPFSPVIEPPVPEMKAESGGRTPMDAFLIQALEQQGLQMRPEATPEVLVRRVYLDLTGLAPTPEERAAFLADPSPAAYEKLVDRLLADPRHAERWARHWMDIWRYSDWAGWNDGGQIRDSQPHIWRWRDWIVESLAADKGYDAMVTDMLAADERAPEDPQALRATGFLARNYKLLSREQWLEDTVNHTTRAFLGLTVGCAKCHDHKKDPIPQTEYYAIRAIFEPHQVRQDQVPGEVDTLKAGLARVYDADPAVPTYLFVRGDERKPDKDHPIAAAVPVFLGGSLEVSPVTLPSAAVAPQKREFVRQALESASEKAFKEAKDDAPLALAKERALNAVLAVERLEEAGKKGTPEYQEAQKTAVAAQREEAVQTALRKVITATSAKAAAEEKKGDVAAADKALTEARDALNAALATAATPVTGECTPRAVTVYPAQSTGRRLAFARWLTRRDHPLTARVAVNYLWSRHFGAGLVPTVSDFGPGGRPPVNPALLDWLAADFMEHGWSLRHLHRTLCLSAAYRQSSMPGTDTAGPLRDPDNTRLWHFPARRLEAEAVRDNILYLTNGLDSTRGGPEIDEKQALTSPRRSLYLRCAPEKQAEFIQVFDGPSVVDCYERKPSVMPQQALAMLNSSLTRTRAGVAAASWQAVTDDPEFVKEIFVRFLTREPQAEETALCLDFLKAGGSRSRENLILTLLNHHEFVTLR